MADDKVFEIDKDDIRILLAKLDAATGEDVIKKSLGDGARHIQDWIRTQRLTGPRPTYLGVVSGNLRRSIVSSKAEKTQGGYMAKIGLMPMIGKAHIYGPVHEYGYSGIVNVRSFLRKIGKIKLAKKNIGTMLGLVRAHTRFMRMPARPFMSPGIEDESNRKYVEETLIENISEAINKAK